MQIKASVSTVEQREANLPGRMGPVLLPSPIQHLQKKEPDPPSSSLPCWVQRAGENSLGRSLHQPSGTVFMHNVILLWLWREKAVSE